MRDAWPISQASRGDSGGGVDAIPQLVLGEGEPSSLVRNAESKDAIDEVSGVAVGSSIERQSMSEAVAKLS